MSHSNGKFVFPGIKIKDSLEIQLYEGWNLVNIYNSNKASYSGFDVLKQMNSQSINAVAISKWEDSRYYTCLLYTSDAADDLLCVDLGGRRIIKKKIIYNLEKFLT